MAWIDLRVGRPSFALHPECADDVTVDYVCPCDDCGPDGARRDDCGNTIVPIFTLEGINIECCEVCNEPLN